MTEPNKFNVVKPVKKPVTNTLTSYWTVKPKPAIDLECYITCAECQRNIDSDHDTEVCNKCKSTGHWYCMHKLVEGANCKCCELKQYLEADKDKLEEEDEVSDDTASTNYN